MSPVEQRLRALHARYRDLDEGDVASYIPELAGAFPDSFGICVATVDGEVYEVGDSREPFTIQSVSKPFLFGLALEDYGREGLLERVGVEPTGDPFNAIVLDEVANRPPNPMVNAGAIAVTGLVQGRDTQERWARIHGVLEAFAGRPLKVDDAVALSESRTGHRNRAIAHLMRTFDMVREDVDEVLELYFRQCAVQVDAVDLALMGATLAAGGRNPSTGERAIAAEHLPSVLSVMTSCGMYDASGTWLYRVGLPAKSGVGGGVVAVLPGQVGIGVFSPRLDRNGNSVRGLRVCEDLSQDLGMHLFSGTRWAADTVRAVYDRSSVTSRHVRTLAQEAVLREHGREILVVEMQGRLVFGAVERLSRHVAERISGIRGRLRHLVLDMARVHGGDRAASVLLVELLAAVAGRGVDVVVAGHHSRGDLAEALADDQGRWTTVSDLDRALERAEHAVLEVAGEQAEPGAVTLAEVEVCAGLSPEDLAALAEVAPLRRFAAGEVLCRPGDPGTSAFLLLEGRLVVSALGRRPGAPPARLRVLGPGSMVGEMALLSGGLRSAMIEADADVVCHELTAEGLDAFTAARPLAAVQLLRNVAVLLAQWLKDAHRDPGDALVAGPSGPGPALPSR